MPNEKNNQISRVDALLGKPLWVIDYLPSQVPAEGEGQFFAVERRVVLGKRGKALRRSFAEFILKLNCYYDMLTYKGAKEKGKRNPKPKKLEAWIVENKKQLSIVLPSANALLVIPAGSTCIAVYNPTPELLEQIRGIAASCGLYLWQPPSSGEPAAHRKAKGALPVPAE